MTENLPLILDKFERMAKLGGWNLHRASGYEDAIEYAVLLVKSLGVENVVRSDQPVFDALPLDSALVNLGLTVTPVSQGELRSRESLREEIVASNWVGGCLFVALLSLAGFFVAGNAALLSGAVAFAVLVLPLSGMFNCDEGWPRMIMGFITASLALAGATGVILSWGGSAELGTNLFVLAIFGAVLSTWVGNGLSSVTVKH